MCNCFGRCIVYGIEEAFYCESVVPVHDAAGGKGQITVNLALIKSHSLRIGGHTYFTAMGMAPDLTATSDGAKSLVPPFDISEPPSASH